MQYARRLVEQAERFVKEASGAQDEGGRQTALEKARSRMAAAAQWENWAKSAPAQDQAWMRLLRARAALLSGDGDALAEMRQARDELAGVKVAEAQAKQKEARLKLAEQWLDGGVGVKPLGDTGVDSAAGVH